ncbi:hypothetical protein J3F83DRAFT_724034 [Trichoderma novae-zelandiae]
MGAATSRGSQVKSLSPVSNLSWLLCTIMHWEAPPVPLSVFCVVLGSGLASLGPLFVGGVTVSPAFLWYSTGRNAYMGYH